MDADKTCLFMFVQDARADSAKKIIVTSPNLKKPCGFHCVSCESRAFIFHSWILWGQVRLLWLWGEAAGKMDFGGATQRYPMDHSFWVVFQCVLTFVDVFWCIFICWGSWLTQINRDSHLHQSYLLCEWFELFIPIFEDDYLHDMYSNYDYVWDCTRLYLCIIYTHGYCR